MVRGLPHPAEKIGGRGKVDAEVDLPQLVNTVEPFDPDGRLFGLLLLLVPILFVEQCLVLVLRFRRYAIRVVSLVIEHDEVSLSAKLPAENSLDQGAIAFDPALSPDLDAHQMTRVIEVAIEDLELALGLERS